jgi:hypothetical protein
MAWSCKSAASESVSTWLGVIPPLLLGHQLNICLNVRVFAVLIHSNGFTKGKGCELLVVARRAPFFNHRQIFLYRNYLTIFTFSHNDVKGNTSRITQA